MATILVTGGAGYVGSHAVRGLQRRGHEVVVLDSLARSTRAVVDNVLRCDLVVGDISDATLLDRTFRSARFDAVMHFAAYAYVSESMSKPDVYYRNNVGGTLSLLDGMLRAGVSCLVFSSSCAVYGMAQTDHIAEDHPCAPINPYGASKLMAERMMSDYGDAFGLRSVRLRYFNAAGADPDATLGESHEPETHLIPLCLRAAAGELDEFVICGTDYATDDGTCVRDFVHVCDIADAHVRALDYLLQGGVSTSINLSTGEGRSVMEVVSTAGSVTGRPIPVRSAPRRPGDPPRLVGTGDRAREVLGWIPCRSDLPTILADAWRWHVKGLRGTGRSAPEVVRPPDRIALLYRRSMLS